MAKTMLKMKGVFGRIVILKMVLATVYRDVIPQNGAQIPFS